MDGLVNNANRTSKSGYNFGEKRIMEFPSSIFYIFIATLQYLDPLCSLMLVMVAYDMKGLGLEPGDLDMDHLDSDHGAYQEVLWAEVAYGTRRVNIPQLFTS